MRIFSIVGARPQFIKLAPLSAALSGLHEEFIVHTGQHYDYAMSEKIFEDLGIRKPDIHLEVGGANQTEQIAAMLLKLDAAMSEKKPDAVIVFGDTNSTLAGALIAAKQNIPLVHIEAGLRSFNRSMPEEINRITADHLSTCLLAPTQTAVNNLEREGLGAATFLTGDIMVDTMQNSIGVARAKSVVVKQMGLENEAFYLLTLHRHYNVDDTGILMHILDQLGQLEQTVIFPVHPRTRKMLPAAYKVPGNIRLTEPQGYIDFIALQQAAEKIITDSGGIQKEAYILKKPCITLRTETEWVETVTEKWNLLVQPGDTSMAEKISGFSAPGTQQNIFGTDVTKKILEVIHSIKL
ncbi:MAG: UDP-N-acetylglucosamine 2-epimerase (non-hydrolyzing) [Ferruginibacter sp.]